MDLRVRRREPTPTPAVLRRRRDLLRRGCRDRGVTPGFVGIAYPAATLGVVDGVFAGHPLAPSLLVGAAMFLASLHPLVDVLSFAPAGFLGYATLIGAHASGATVAVGGLPGETLGAVVSMLVGAAIGFVADRMSTRLAPTHASVGPR